MSTFPADVDPVATAPRVGADLSAARLRLGWSLEAVAGALRIRLPFLAALEEGRIVDLPGNAYAIGFLRSYAGTLGLDPDELTRRFRAEAGEVNRLTELTFPAPVPSRGVPAGAVVLLGVVLAVGAYVGWYRLSGNGRLPPEVVPPVPARLAPLAERAVPPEGVTQSSSTRPASSTLAASSTLSASSTGPLSAGTSASGSSSPGASSGGASSGGVSSGGVSSPGASSAAPSSGPGAAAPSASTRPASDLAAGLAATPLSPPPPATNTTALPEPAPFVPPSQAAAATTMLAAPAAPAAPQSRIVLSATADAWMMVRDKSGQVLLNRVLHAGEFWPVPPQPNLLLTVGNAGGTDIMVDGATIPTLGGSGAVRHDIPLDADLLKSGKVPSASLPVSTASSGAPVVSPSSPPIPPRWGSQ
jgi:cytoskeleton protein RodZ